MLRTAKMHFDDDISRARALVTQAKTLTQGTLHDDILRSAWMMVVGACDAYFSDAYADLISRALRAKDLEPAINFPDRLNNLKIPVIAVLRQAGGGWRWRMAAREMIEDENVLSLHKIRRLFNHFFPNGPKPLNQDSIEAWITHREAKTRLFGCTATEFRAKKGAAKEQAKKDALQHFEERYEQTFQRRHDCIHNCDRPKQALQPIGNTQASKTIEDIEFLVARCHDALLAGFPNYLKTLGFNSVTRNQVCA